MSVTPGKGRSSAIPTPGRTTGIPTPGRPRSASGIHQPPAASSNPEDEYISRAFADAIRANDPANHRASHGKLSLSPPFPQFPSQSGHRSVPARPSSVASSSSAASATATRNTTQPLRPASRSSDVFTRSSSRADKTFDVGDNVRVESLGFEGALRFLGEIDGKSGLFAGVELSGGFAGKGKNDGSVNGKRYFTCPPGCGIFILSNKLSSPTAGHGNLSRPSSVASTRNGRATPSLSGRITPSFSSSVSNGRKTSSHSFPNGRATPGLTSGRVTPSASAGRSTPGTILPPARARTTTITKNTVTPSRAKPSESIITPGSRASKYVGMTAKQLSGRAGAASPSRKSISSPTFSVSSPTHPHLTSPSRTRTISSPFTPKAGRTQGIGVGMPSGTPTRSRNGPGTPRARLPSSVSMPPPPSPSNLLNNRAVSLNDPIVKSDIDLAASGKVIQDMIGNLMSGRSPSSRPPSSASMTSSLFAEQQLQLQNERLQARFDALEDENKRLRSSLTSAESSSAMVTSRLKVATEAAERSAVRVAEMESSLRSMERTVVERDSTIEALERSVKETIADIDKAKSDGEARVRDIQSKLDDKELLVAQLKELIDAKEGMQSENDAVLSAKNAEIALLESRVQKAYGEMEDERRELGGQVDELRKAGQETIALYEERLSAADAKRYEMEDLVASLEEQLRIKARPISPATVARQAVSAAEIDNEAMKEQIQHLQKKLVSLEDALEDAQVSAEREELAVRERVLRYKEREDGVRKELAESQKEVERVLKLEESARMRIEEIEEALRENTVALENARAEIEGLRADVADLEGVASAGGSPPKASSRSAASGDYEMLKADKIELERAQKQQQAELTELRGTCSELRYSLQALTSELEIARKKLNREAPVNGLQDSTKHASAASSKDLAVIKDDLKSHKEEIKGHKHIIQELQKELARETHRSKVLESENKLLITEIAQLREDMKKLEDTFEQTLVREEQQLAAETGDMASTDVATLQRSVRDLKMKYEAEIDQLRRGASEAEMKTARTVHDLHKEIGELESLIETKIYREDELESEIERLKERLARSQKKSSKTGLPEDSRLSVSSTTTPASQTSSPSSYAFPSQPFPPQPFPTRANRFSEPKSAVSGEEVCEICERPGHDIFTCDLLKDDRPLSTASLAGLKSTNDSNDLFCDDCEERGHIAANCPHSLDVF
ncbi:hypothetical protein BC835DRAFT_1417033 [Cytidiella melzeri]|nr:hypothetical protein BC835DRAFT_1417033 [Cytidiella melzeri]